MRIDLSTSIGRYRARKAGYDVPKMRTAAPPKDIDSLIDRSGECWLWTHRTDIGGYGVYHADGRAYKAHRYIYARDVGPIPEGSIVMHLCDVRACCRPSHLRLGSQADNIRDKVSKSRQAKGESNGSSKLLEEEVLAIRAKYKPRIVTYEMLASEYMVCADLIRKVVHRIYWKHV